MVATYNIRGDIGNKFDFIVKLYNSLCGVLSYKFNYPGEFGWSYDCMPDISYKHPYYKFDLIDYHLVSDNVYDFYCCIISIYDGETVKITFNNDNVTPTKTLDADELGDNIITELTNNIDNINI